MKKLIQSIAAAAFFIQALIPIGFMLNAHASIAGTTLVICSGLDVKTIYVDEQGKQLPSHKKSETKSPCLYSGLTVFKSAELFSILPSAISYVVIDKNIQTYRFVQSDKYLKPPAIGPPILL